MKKSFKYVFVGALMLAISGGCWAQPAWAVWSFWYWPWNDDYNPNLFDSGETMYRYDLYTGAYSQWWEYNYHGPPQDPDPWRGHCHVWSAAAVWESHPEYSKWLQGIKFRIRDRKGLLVETYNACANGDSYELYVDNPTPGTFWKYLGKELGAWTPCTEKKWALSANSITVMRYGITLFTDIA